MESYIDIVKYFRSEQAVKTFHTLYGNRDGRTVYEVDRYSRIVRRFAKKCGENRELHFFSSPGRSEIIGNHTDHNQGCVLAAAVTMDSIACVSINESKTIRFYSEGYPDIEMDLSDLSPVEEEQGTTKAIIRGAAAFMQEKGIEVSGFDATVTSDVLGGSGLSSSASIELLILTIFNQLFGNGQVDPKELAVIAQKVENIYFHKPCGLMDQMVISVGGLVGIDFGKQSRVRPVQYDFSQKGYALAVVNTGSSHDNLTPHYAAIPEEMKAVAQALGGEVLRDVLYEQLMADIPALREKVSDRAILRAMHYFDENKRVRSAVEALEKDELQTFFDCIIDSGRSSIGTLQNVFIPDGDNSLSLALEVSRRMLEGRGAWRVHGGGFAGTILAFVPNDLLDAYTAQMDGIFGDHATIAMGIRPMGAMEVFLEG